VPHVNQHHANPSNLHSPDVMPIQWNSHMWLKHLDAGKTQIAMIIVDCSGDNWMFVPKQFKACAMASAYIYINAKGEYNAGQTTLPAGYHELADIVNHHSPPEFTFHMCFATTDGSLCNTTPNKADPSEHNLTFPWFKAN
jgi:hypothetical protein